MAAGFADPAWVPVTITAWAFSWGDDEIQVDALPVRHQFDQAARAKFLEPLFDAIDQADILTGHNIVRFDLPALQGESVLLGRGPMPRKLIQDTIQLRGVRVKKGQDVLAQAFGVDAEKLPLNWAQWQAAYNERDLSTVKDRVVGDVAQHMQLRAAMRDRGWLPRPVWR